MEKKSSPGRYMLIFQPQSVSYQYAVYFNPDGTTEVSAIKRNSDIVCNTAKKKVKKNTLADIDKIMSSVSNLKEFFEKYIDPNVFQYSGFNVYKMFIGYRKNDSMYTFDYTINNPELQNKMQFVSGSKIRDIRGRQQLVNLILTSSNNSFLDFVEQESRTGKSRVSKELLNIAVRLRRVCDNCGSGSERYELETLLDEKLTAYKEYRELFLSKQRYVKKLEEEKQRYKAIKEETKIIDKRSRRSDEIQGATQLSFLDPHYEAPKTKKLI